MSIDLRSSRPEGIHFSFLLFSGQRLAKLIDPIVVEKNYIRSFSLTLSRLSTENNVLPVQIWARLIHQGGMIKLF